MIPEHVPEISEYKEKFNLLTNRIKILEDQLVQSSKNIKLVEDQLIQSSKNIQLVAIQRTDEIRDRIENLADCLNRSNKKIDEIESHSFLSDSFIESVGEIADFNASSIGAVLSALIPIDHALR